MNKPRTLSLKGTLAPFTGIATQAQTKQRQDSGDFSYAKPPSRQGRICFATYHEPAVVKQIKQLSLDRGVTQQKLVAEAFNLLFLRYGLPPIA
jgi:hypothetical protein